MAGRRTWIVGILAFTACSDGGARAIDPTLQFTLQEDAMVDRLVLAAVAVDANRAASSFTRLQQLAPDFGCPFMEINNGGVTLRGGCSGFFGPNSFFFVEGVAHTTNPPDADVRYQFEQFSVIGLEGGDAFYQGTVEHAVNTVVADITVDQFDGSLRSLLSIACKLGSCEVAGGVELARRGGALVSGTVETLDGVLLAGSGSWSLRGADTVEVELSQGCVTWRIVESGRTHGLPCIGSTSKLDPGPAALRGQAVTSPARRAR